MVVQKRVSMLCGVNLQNGYRTSQMTFLIKVARRLSGSASGQQADAQRTAVNGEV